MSANPGLYLHVPFCRTKCPYCDFYSVTEVSVVSAWLQALALEIALDPDPSARCDTFYLGGGTPSLLAPQDLETIFRWVHEHFTISADAEITLEANPDDVTPAKLCLWRELGVNRLSLGVQSLDDAELRFLGRRHDAAGARRALDLAREVGWANLGVDLIYALPGQTEARWLATLGAVLAWRPEHLSCYQLTIEKGTPLDRRLARGEVRASSEEGQRRLFLRTSEFLAAAGYCHYEISNFANSGVHVSRHNSKYWQHVPYLGLGPAAHSFDGRVRRWNVRSVADYCRLLGTGRVPVAGSEVLTEAQLRLEALALGLRTRRGVALADLAHFPQAGQVLGGLVEAGLLAIQGGRACPTPQGFLVADSLALMLSE